MGLYERSNHRRVASVSALRSYDDLTDHRPSRWAFLRRRVALRSSSISVSMGVLLGFPGLVILVIIFLIVTTSGPSILHGPKVPATMRKLNPKYDDVFSAGCLEPDVNAPRASAAFVVLSRNKELEGIVQSIKSIERHFNRWFHYPYVFLNDDEFNSTFKETVRKHVSAPVEFGLIEPEMWGFPDWVNKTEAREAIHLQGDQGDEAIMYGGLESYHHMCRFYSGNFYRHPLLQKYKWYWRLEPEITYFCDITYDPFIHMERHNKTYGWTIAIEEIRETIPNLFRYVSAFKRNRGIESKGLWEMFLQKPDPKKEAARAKAAALPPKDGLGTRNIPDVDPEAMEGETYNTCHFWSNFEIANMEWYRSKEYEDFFHMLEHSGGFWQERWGDAPVHSLAAGVLLSRDQVHYFRDFGYRHTTIQHCPNNAPGMQLPRQPWLDPNADSPKQAKKDDDYWAKYDRPQENGVGCRCRCDRDVPYDNEVAEGSCFPQWAEVIGGFV